MLGLMQDVPLTLDLIFDRAEQLWSDKRILTATPAGIERTDYGTWAQRTRRLGGVLDALGVSADGRVATFAWNTARHLELYYAVPLTGRVLHALNLRLFPEQIVYIVNHAEDEVVFVDRSLLPLLWPHVEQCPTVRHVVVMDDTAGRDPIPPLPDDPRILDYERLLQGGEPHPFGVVGDENTAAAMCYTSGTTGDPKGVVYSHRSMTLHALAGMVADAMGMREADVVMPVVPMFHANAWGMCQIAPLAGSDLLLPGSDLSPATLARLIVEEGVTLTAGVPTIWKGVLPHLAGRPHRLRVVFGGGSAVSKSLSEAYRGEVGLPIQQAWGMTETSPVATMGYIRRARAGGNEEELAEVRACQGLPAPLVEMRVADAATGAIVAWDGKASGEIQVRGPWIARSYYHDSRSGEQFTDDGWLRTGDIGVMTADGYVRLVDRTKDLIKSGGEWISSVDLENEIMAHPAVAEAAVIAVPSEKWMERPMACVVLEPGRQLSAEELKGWLRPRVAKWWLPDLVEFIEEVPKTSVGKFFKRALREMFADRQVP